MCGDGFCTAEVGETCDTCSTDCCPGVIAGIILSVFLVSIPVVILIAVFVVCYFDNDIRRYLAYIHRLFSTAAQNV